MLNSAYWYTVLTFCLALILALVLTPLAGRLARRVGAVDVPGQIKHTHTIPTPRLGGLGMYLAFAIPVLLTLWWPILRADSLEVRRVVGLLVGMTLVEIMGVLDDRFDLPSRVQLLVIGIASLLAVLFFEIRIDILPNPLDGPLHLSLWLALPFTFFWLMGMTSTVNLLDGLDGLAAGVTAIAAGVLLVHTARLGQISLTPLPAALLGATLGFLPYNFHPAKLFMGSSGAYMLGFALAVLSVIGGAKVASALLVMGIPIMDVASIIIARIRQKTSPVSHADRNHLHHRLYDRGLSQRMVVLLYYTLSLIFGGLALLLPPGIYKLYALLILGLILLILLWAVTRPREPV
ncbi:MAG: undecaprenyl/decaprenyl-phosphate alpha-N-acetylglucosaminyl 1-phosphate transferase [Chloroflexi bacterium]|nr:undecaprenyl/decaprenyl-phosphate alpha-N-acetylglucosaminyl 1-phosphate transferase [Chloroflexota bacterium]